MKTIEVVVQSACGLHARPAFDFTKRAKKYSCKITLTKSGHEAINAKSIIEVLSLGVSCGEVISISCDGQDEDLAAMEMAEVAI
ncbi:MAG TPA: HPr family phosphocarrier protein [Anaerolineaceae bacterium]|nr:HPr family phosphocarrier protein [Anaerolineaceae bacterium]